MDITVITIVVVATYIGGIYVGRNWERFTRE